MNRDQAHSLIKNANTSGQGFYEKYSENPFHEVLIKNGFEYSHTTPIGSIDGTYYLQTTYKHKSNRVIGIDCLNGNYRWHSSKSTSSGHKTVGLSNAYLEKHLKNVLRKK